MHEMPLIYVFGVLGQHFLFWDFGQWHLVIGVFARVHTAMLSQIVYLTIGSNIAQPLSIVGLNHNNCEDHHLILYFLSI